MGDYTSKKILIATGIYPPDIGGPATYSKLLFDELPKQGIRVEVLSFGSVRHLPRLIRHFIYFLKLLNRGRSFDLFYAQDPVSVGLPVCLASKILRKKFFLKIVGDYAWEQYSLKAKNFITPEEFQNKKFGFVTELRRKAERGVAKRATGIVVPSQYLKKIVLMWGIEARKISVVYNVFSAPKLIQRSPVSCMKPGFVLVSVGRLVPWKGFGALIEIMPEILKEIPDAKLFIIGSGPEGKNLKSQISNLKIEGEVSLLGQLPREKVLEYLRSADLFVLNTGYEGLSHQILEAMAVGIPIVTTDVGGNPELIENKKSGLLVPYNDKDALRRAILDLYENPGLRKEITQNARQKLEEFKKEKMIKQIIKVLCES